MPIDFNTLKLTSEFLTVDASATVGAVYALLPKDKRETQAFLYVLAPLADGRYFVARWIEIEEIARRAGPGMVRGTKLADLAGLPEPTTPAPAGGYAKLASRSFKDLQRLLTPCEALERAGTSTQEARQARDGHPARRAVAVEGGQVLGILAVDMLSGDALGSDPFRRGGGATLGIDDAPADRSGGQAATAGDTPSSPTGEAAAKPEGRVFNYWLERLNDNGTTTALKNTEPLDQRLSYELKINLNKPRADAFATTGAETLAPVESELAPEQSLYEVTVVLDTSDFTIYGSKEQVLAIWKGSFSKNTVAFTIEPKQEGVGTISAAFFVRGRCFQVVELKLQVGGKAGSKQVLFAEKTSGKSLSAITRAGGESDVPVSLVLLREPAGYRAILSGAGVTRATLNLSEAQLAELVGSTRTALLEVVNREHNGEPIYQSEVLDIPAEIHKETLQKLARQGTLLFQRLFYGPGMGADARAMGDLLKKISQERQLHVEIIAERFIFPWALLFDGDRNAAEIDPRGFWGFKHIIEYMPEYSVATPINFVPEIRLAQGARMPMAFVANTTIDQELSDANYPPVIGPQTDFFGSLATVALDRRTTRQEFFSLLSDENAPPLIYLNCHAVSKQVGEQGGVYSSKIRLSDGDITLDDLDLDAPPLPNGLKNGPIVFLNACQSAELSPYLYAGLVPAMIQRGARGVIGTEVDTPSQFAADFAKQFVSRFSAGGKPLGELLLELRSEYLAKNNVMALLYALYSSGEVVVARS